MESTHIHAYAQELAQRVENAWRAANWNEDQFPALATEALEALPFPEPLDAQALFRYGLLFPNKTHQSNPGYAFGDPPLALCRRELFEVGVLFWLDGTTSIHQHAFSGAFQVLEGSSLHATYRFSERERINERLLFGELACTGYEFLERRDIRPIVAGPTFLHSLFHLARPSITLIIRTHGEDRWGPQYDYRRPGVALHPFHKTPERILRRRLFHSLLSLELAGRDALIEAVLREGGLEDNLRLLVDSIGILREKNYKTDALVALVTAARPDLKPIIKELLAEELRVSNIAARRKAIVAEDHRFFLALLLNLPDRKSILEAIAWRCGDDPSPVSRLMHWVRELGTSEKEADSALGIALDPMKLSVLEGLLLEKNEDALRAFVSERMQVQSLPFHEKEFQMARFILPELRIFKPLLVSSEPTLAAWRA